MNEFQKSIRYTPYEDTHRRNYKNNTHRDTQKRTITGKRPVRKSKEYRIKQAMKQRMIALALAGGLVVGGIGIGTAVKNFLEAQEEKYVSNIEEMEKYNITAQDLQILPELFEHVMNLNEELEQANENGFEDVSNPELAGYYSEMSDLYLDLLKGKISTVTGLNPNEFTLVAPSAHGTEITGTAVKDPEMLSGVGINLKSIEIDEYMGDILTLREYSSQISKGDIDRSSLESKLMDYKDKLGEVATLNLLREMSGKDGLTKLTSYRIETRDLQQSQSTERTSEIEK